MTGRNVGFVSFVATIDTADQRVSKFLIERVTASKTILDPTDRKRTYSVLLAIVEATRSVCNLVERGAIKGAWDEMLVPLERIRTEVAGKGHSLSSTECQHIIDHLCFLRLVEPVGIEGMAKRYRIADNLIEGLQVCLPWSDSSLD